MGRRNPIHVVGEAPRKGYTVISDELIRAGGHDRTLGSDGLLVMAFLLSWATSVGSSGKRVWETSAAQMSQEFGWGANRERVRMAIERATKDGRLIVREYVRGGHLVARRRAYVVAAGGRRFTDDERVLWSRPIEIISTQDETA